jgi:hypothetical protein
MRRYNTRVGIEVGTEVRDAAGGVSYTYTTLHRAASLMATILPHVDENRQERYTEAESHWNIIIDGHHPDITTSMWVTNNAERYEIIRVATTKRRHETVIMARQPNI